ncbi:MAG: hypothetical protein V1679_00455, partial [Candidatus Peregrinibacteria bacterium]
MKFVKKIKEIECEDACCVFNRVSRGFDRRFLFESKDISHIYGRLSLIGVDPVIEVRGKGNKFSVEVLCERGRGY